MPLRPGARLAVDKCKATVRYVGAIDDQQGTWVGLEWDDISRGKHDGAVGGRRYFTCKLSAPRGSFVREAKLQQVADLGINLPLAIITRYQQDAADFSESRNTAAAEIVGVEAIMQQQALVQEATSFTLSNSRVASIGPPGELRALAPHIRELDLADNLLPSWSEAVQLAQELPKLASLDLSLNRMAWPPVRPGPDTVAPFLALETLVLNQCCLSWREVCRLEPWLPALTALHLSGNDMSALDGPALPEGAFSRLQVRRTLALGRDLLCLQALVLDDNMVTDWHCLRPLYSLSSLTCLSLSDNSIAAIPAAELSPGALPNLATLWLGNNCVSSWQSVDALSALPALRELRLSRNPVLLGPEGEARSEVIARLGSLQTVNATPVTAHERKDSELQYLRDVLGQLSGMSATAAEEFLQKHPRLQHLQAKYRDTGASAAAPRQGAALSSSMVQLRLTCLQNDRQSATLTKRFPRSTQLGKLRQLCERLFKLPTLPVVLSLKDPEGSAMPCRAAEGATLADLDVLDGSDITFAVAEEVQDSSSLHPAVHTHGSIDSALLEHKQLKHMEVLARAATPDSSGIRTGPLLA